MSDSDATFTMIVFLIVSAILFAYIIFLNVYNPPLEEGYIPSNRNGGIKCQPAKKECAHEWRYVSSGAYSACTKCGEIKKGHYSFCD